MDETVVRSELILGGQRSGKSRRAELLARAWLAADGAHRAVLIATARAWDDEMRARIERHQRDRAARVPGMATVETPHALPEAIDAHAVRGTLVVVDCLTLWLTQLMMPAEDEAGDPLPAIEALQQAVARARGPLVLVSNEIGLGVIPMGRETRAFVDTLGWLNQAMAQSCERVGLMAAGLRLPLKEPR